jgi:hypothetical protein
VRFYATGMLQRVKESGRRLPHAVTPAPHRRVAAHSVRALRGGVPSALCARKLGFAAVITESDSTPERCDSCGPVAGPKVVSRQARFKSSVLDGVVECTN